MKADPDDNKFLTWGIAADARTVTYARYTGQESQEERDRVLNRRPDILLTNYVMLEYLLTRPVERQRLIGAAQGLRFLVLDELHTYRGRQGADVALLVRRLRDACNSPALQCVGTSATMATSETFAQTQEIVAEVATRLFGTSVAPRPGDRRKPAPSDIVARALGRPTTRCHRRDTCRLVA